VGTFGYDAGSARIKAFADQLKSKFNKIEIVSAFPGREEKPISFETNEIPVRYLSFFSKNAHFLGVRIVKVLFGLFRLYGTLLFSKNENTVLYFYNPTFFTTISHIYLSKILSIVTVIDIVECFQHEKNTWYNRLGDKWAFKYATIPFAISDKLMDYGGQYTKKPIMKLPIVVDFERFKDIIQPAKKKIGYVGTSAAKDGLDIVLKGFAEATNTDKQLKLLLIGPKPTFFNFDALVAQLNLAEKIEITGSINFEKIPSLLLTCDSFVMNRDNALFAQYGYPTKLGEYFACNRPVLMSDGLGFSEDFTDKEEAIKYEVNNPKALAEAIKWRYENEDKAQIIAQKGYDYAKNHFSKEVVGEIFVNRLKNA
jgi:glycosyltransferase involved in cell wall biosynthesis